MLTEGELLSLEGETYRYVFDAVDGAAWLSGRETSSDGAGWLCVEQLKDTPDRLVLAAYLSDIEARVPELVAPVIERAVELGASSGSRGFRLTRGAMYPATEHMDRALCAMARDDRRRASKHLVDAASFVADPRITDSLMTLLPFEDDEVQATFARIKTAPWSSALERLDELPRRQRQDPRVQRILIERLTQTIERSDGLDEPLEVIGTLLDEQHCQELIAWLLGDGTALAEAGSVEQLRRFDELRERARQAKEAQVALAPLDALGGAILKQVDRQREISGLAYPKGARTLIQRVLNAPEELGPRAVLADLLLEHDHPRGALFSSASEARTQATLLEHWRRWTYPIDLALQPGSARFSNGFLSDCRLARRWTEADLKIGDPVWSTVSTLRLSGASIAPDAREKASLVRLLTHPVLHCLRTVRAVPPELIGGLFGQGRDSQIEVLELPGPEALSTDRPNWRRIAKLLAKKASKPAKQRGLPKLRRVEVHFDDLGLQNYVRSTLRNAGLKLYP